MADKETLFIKCDCGKKHQLWDCDSIPWEVGSTLYTFTCGPCGKLFNIQVIEKEFNGYHGEEEVELALFEGDPPRFTGKDGLVVSIKPEYLENNG